MVVVKNINNNVSICLDSRNNEVVVFGKGVGFIKPPAQVPLDRIEKTFYNVHEEQIHLLNTIPAEVLEVSWRIVDYANQLLGNQFSSNVVFTLADHITFAMKRKKEDINIKLPIYQEVEQIYENEYYVGKYALTLIEKTFHMKLDKSEAAAIALHLINYEVQTNHCEENNSGKVVEKCICCIEETMDIRINRENFNYYRFVTHLYYLLKRIKNKQMIESPNESIYEALKKEFPGTYQCSEKVSDVITGEIHEVLSDEEKMYLMLHINRLFEREIH